MSNRTPLFRADHVGSLLRPLALAEAREKARKGEISKNELRAVQDDCIREAVRQQENIGLNVITDGEFRRDYWHVDFLCGFEGIDEWEAERSPTFSSGWRPLLAKANRKVSWKSGIFTDHFAFLKNVTSRTAKQTIPGPAMIHLRPGREAIDPHVYPDMDEFWSDLVSAYRMEVAKLYELGCRYLQIDDVSFSYFCDKDLTDMLRSRGDDPKQLLRLYARLINDVIVDRPSDLRVSTHICRGNAQSAWIAQGGYEPVAEVVFGSLNVDSFFLEYDSDRAGGFEPLRYMPKSKDVVLGLISSKVPALESAGEIKRRLDEAAKFIALERMALSPQCGFASTYHGNKVTPDDQWRKLELVVDVAEDVWGKLTE
jgi:5-methyltetrahydropteroyltriglutamate--homocysteine methyltransferase